MQAPAQLHRSFKGIAQQYPEFVTWLRDVREKYRDNLEQGANDVTRGQALALKELIAVLDTAKNAP